MSHSTRLACKVSAAYGVSRCLLLLPPVDSIRAQPAPGVALPALLRPPAPALRPPHYRRNPAAPAEDNHEPC